MGLLYKDYFHQICGIKSASLGWHDDSQEHEILCFCLCSNYSHTADIGRVKVQVTLLCRRRAVVSWTATKMRMQVIMENNKDFMEVRLP